jgi:branched-chain amino acid transport system substrate-binding protein
VFRDRSAAAVGLAVMLIVAACSGDDDASPESTALATTSTVVAARPGDGQLRIGVLLPTSDAVIGEPLIAATRQAVGLINDAGGVLGRDVDIVVEDEGDTVAIASESIQRLIAADVDAIVGPSSSLIALGTLDDIVSAGIVSCSPTASALALDDFPDDELFFRTIPSDSMQAEAITDVVERTGSTTVALVHVNDGYGQPFAEAVAASLDARGITVIETLPFSGHDDDLADDAASIVATGAQVVVVLADGQDGTSFISALGQTDHGSLQSIIVNDAMRMPSSPQVIQGLDPALREKLRGVAPQAEPTEAIPYEPVGFFAVNAFDCVNLIALSAMRVESDAPRDIAGQMATVSASGAVCLTFAACRDALENDLDFDYDGPSGVTELVVRQGDPKRARFQEFRFDDTGRDVPGTSWIVEV